MTCNSAKGFVEWQARDLVNKAVALDAELQRPRVLLARKTVRRPSLVMLLVLVSEGVELNHIIRRVAHHPPGLDDANLSVSHASIFEELRSESSKNSDTEFFLKDGCPLCLLA